MITPVFPLAIEKDRKRTPKPNGFGVLFGADIQIRTGDLILTKDALYRLSYISIGDPERARTVDL